MSGYESFSGTAVLLALRRGEPLLSGIEASSLETCLGLLLSNRGPLQRGGSVTRTLPGRHQHGAGDG